MKKLGIALAVAAALLLLFAPLATGLVARARVTERLAAIGDNPALEAEIVAYERGWFASRVELTIGVSGEYLGQIEYLRGIGLPAGPIVLPVIVDLYHGPVSLADGLHVGLTRVLARADPDSAAARFATSELGMPYLFELRGHAGFGNRFDFEADVPPIDYAGPIGDLAFSGLELTGSGRGRSLALEGATDGASYQSPFAAATIGAIRFTSEYEFVADDVPLSDVTLEIERIVASSPMLGASPLFEASDLRLSANVARDPDGQSITMATRHAATTLTAGDDFALSDAELGVSLAGIDAAAAREYYAIMQDAAATAPGDVAGQLDRLGPVLERIAAAGPRLTIEPIRFTMPEGRFDGSLDATIDTSSLPPGQAVDLRNLAVLFGAIAVTAELTVAKALAQRLAVAAMRAQMAAGGAGDATPAELEAMAEGQAGLMLVALVGQGVLEDAGGDYATSIEFRNGALTVNGAPMPLGLL